ncbi:MAG: hypothetical protein ACTSP9_18210 [Promethearchaeota archaeon]
MDTNGKQEQISQRPARPVNDMIGIRRNKILERRGNKMKVYRLYTICPFYGDVTEDGIYSSNEKVNKAKEILCRNIGIENYDRRFEVDIIELDEMPYDREKQKINH